MDPVPLQPAIPKSSVATKFLRALRLRCPRCGSGGILRQWFKMRDQCPTCGLALERGESSDFWIGAYVFNLVGRRVTRDRYSDHLDDRVVAESAVGPHQALAIVLRSSAASVLSVFPNAVAGVGPELPPL